MKERIFLWFYLKFPNVDLKKLQMILLYAAIILGVIIVKEFSVTVVVGVAILIHRIYLMYKKRMAQVEQQQKE